jgi:hypothetical protein
MSDELLVLPARDAAKIRVVRIPDDIQGREVYRMMTGLIAEVEEQNPDYSIDDVLALLEEHGFTSVEFQLGPALD